MILWKAGHRYVVLSFQVVPKVIQYGSTPDAVCYAKTVGFWSGSYYSWFDERDESLWGHPDSGNTRRNVRTAFHDTQARRGQICGCVGITGLKSCRLHICYLCTGLNSVFGALRDMVLLGKKRYGILLIMILKDFKELLNSALKSWAEYFWGCTSVSHSILKGRTYWCVDDYERTWRLLRHRWEAEKLPDLPTVVCKCGCQITCEIDLRSFAEHGGREWSLGMARVLRRLPAADCAPGGLSPSS